MNSKTAVVTGSGIAGLAMARSLAIRGYKVTVIEKSGKAVGASVRNFGMLWPVGQPSGNLLDTALRSRAIWLDIAQRSKIWYNASGSLHLAYHPDEWQVLKELQEAFRTEGREVALLSSDAVLERYRAVNPQHLLGGLFSATEVIVEPRSAIERIAAYLQEAYEVSFVWDKAVTSIMKQKVFCGKEVYPADIIIICSGADFETLYPEVFKDIPITKCKLQMMRFKSQHGSFNLGTSICAGLSLIHYKSFLVAPSLAELRKRYMTEMQEYCDNGIHVMVSQNNYGELTVGDSHHYARTHEPFDEARINQLILQYLNEFILAADWELVQTWNGIYPKLTNGESWFFHPAEPGVYIFNGLGGAGMTLSFGIAEQCIENII